MTLTIIAAVAFLLHVVVWIGAPASTLEAPPREMTEMAAEAQAS